MKINFQCKNCKIVFDCDIGKINFPENTERPCFEKDITCPACGKLSRDEVLLTEIGQGQLTQIFLNESDYIFDDLHFEAECLACDDCTSLNDLGLCNECAGKLERDLIRQRDWDHSVSAYTLDQKERENLRNKIVMLYGEKLEIIAPDKKETKPYKARKPKKRKNKKRRNKR